MVIVQPDGSIILESGDPNYVAIVIGGNISPENDLLDPAADIPVSQLILQTFSIPFNLPVLGSRLPGYDIKNQDPTTMLKLSLAAELIDDRLAEVEIDEFGFARFYVVGADVATNLDIRYCVPTSQVVNPADLVIIRGYDPPPRRELRSSFDGLQNKEIMDYKECAEESCESAFTSRYATISYDDPQLDQSYNDEIINSYEIGAFESLIGYLIDLDLPDGIEDVPGLKVTFGDSTKEYIKVPAEIINSSFTVNAVQFPGEENRTGLSATTGVLGGVGQGSGGTSVPLELTVINDITGVCTITDTSIAGNRVTLPKSRFERLNKFGRVESDFIGVTDVVFSGQKVTSVTTSPGGFGFDGLVTATVRSRRELISLQHGKNWVWEVSSNGDVDVLLFSIIEDTVTLFICKAYNDPSSVTSAQAPQTNVTVTTLDGLDTQTETGSTAMEGFICNIGDRNGYRAVDNQFCIVVERKRPSIDIFDPRGNAVDIARAISIIYTPLVVVDEPAPIAYASIQVLTSDDGTRTLPAEGIIDQTDGIVDADPTTTQDLEDSSLSILQDNTNGSTIDISFPFCTEDECLDIARNLLALQQGVVNTQSIILGPDSDPLLGQLMPDGSIINDIEYSYSDGSQYLITITTGPKYITQGSFNSSAYQLKTEDVAREAVVLQDKGNGAEYVVSIDGFGEITAVSMILEEISVGDHVQVKLYNVPQERI